MAHPQDTARIKYALCTLGESFRKMVENKILESHAWIPIFAPEVFR